MLKPAPKPLTGSRRDYITARDGLKAKTESEREAALAVAMAGDMLDIINDRHDARCTWDDLARLGWSRDDIAAFGEAARAHLLAGPQADRLRARQEIAA